MWFAYIKLLSLDNDFECPHCGPSPETTIWDGVTLAFNRKHVLPSLEPPTATFKDSPVRGWTHYVYKQQLLDDKELQHLVRMIISGPSLQLFSSMLGEVQSTNMGADECNDDDKDLNGDGGNHVGISKPGDENHVEDSHVARRHMAVAKAKRELLARIEAIPTACERLAKVDAGLGEIFAQQFGLAALAEGTWGAPVFCQFFAQVHLPEHSFGFNHAHLVIRWLRKNQSSRWLQGQLWLHWENLSRLQPFKTLHDWSIFHAFVNCLRINSAFITSF